MIDKPRRGAPEKPAHLRKSPRSVTLTPLQSAKLDILAAAHGVSGSAWVALQIDLAEVPAAYLEKAAQKLGLRGAPAIRGDAS